MQMSRLRHSSLWLDYGRAGRKKKFLRNLSAAATAGEYLWTASDEMRSIECLAPYEDGYRLYRQFMLNKLFPGLPGAQPCHEADIEALDVAQGRLWVSGSHSLTRRVLRKSDTDGVDPRIRKRPSRRLFGAMPLSKDGSTVSPGDALPFKGVGSMRSVLGSNAHIAPFMELPSKDNGLDIEGLTVYRKWIHVGLRGPVVDNVAVIAAFVMKDNFVVDEAGLVLHFVDLGGLGVRDLTRWKDGILILAGPVSSADGPFKLHHWQPRRTQKTQKPKRLADVPFWPDHPEGMCVLERGGAEGLLVLCDTSNPNRVNGTRYRAEWIAL
jgi:hypothetical protein